MASESAHLLQSVLDTLPEAIRIVDEDYTILFLNRAAAAEAGRPETELIGKRCYQECYGQLAPCVFCQTSRAFDSGESFEEQVTRTDRQGQRRTYESCAYPIHDAAGKVRRVIELSRDVTPRRQLEAQVRRSERLASVGELAAGMAHEIRNPLGSIVTAANLLMAEKGAPIDDDQITLLEVVKKEARRLNAILSDFLLYARPREPKPRLTDLNELLRETVEHLRTDARTAKRLASADSPIALELALLESLPPVPVDRDQFKQVLWNIVVNGLQAIPGPGTLTVGTALRDRLVEVTVRDTGKGILAKHLDRIFEPFFSSRREGTGLGLPIAQHLVHAHKGNLSIETEEGKGTLVTVSLPLE